MEQPIRTANHETLMMSFFVQQMLMWIC